MIIDNHTMIAALDQADRVRYYPWCSDLALAGDDYKVNEIVCFVRTASDPLTDFIQVKKYDDGFLLIFLYTEDPDLTAECMEYVDTVKDAFSEIELRTPYPSTFSMPTIRQRFTFAEPEYPGSPVYYMHSADALPPYHQHAEATVFDLKETDRDAIANEIADAIAAGLLDSESMNPTMFVPCTVFSDVKWYILRVNGCIAGYLRAECGYANIYDIGWLYVEPRFRGHGYACDLVMYFSKDMFDHGAIPHYGYAISKESESVARKCGYQSDSDKRFCHRLLPL